MSAIEKIPVLNPLTLRNTVGGELADIFEARRIVDFENLLGVKDLRSKERLSKRVLVKASKLLESPQIVETLTNFQETYLEEKPRYIQKYKQAQKLYRKLSGVIPLLRDEFNDGYDILEDIFDFFDVSGEEELYKECERQAALFRKQNNISEDPINLYAWLRRGEIDFNAMTLPEYNESALTQWIDSCEWRNHIEDVNYFKNLPSVFAQFGIGLIFVPSLPKTVYGAIRWFGGKPLIQISDRGHDLISCWFTLFHELGHVIKHKNVEIYEGGINESKSVQNKREREANKFANQYLFNGDGLRKAVYDRKKSGKIMTANALAAEFNVKPIFASYWLRKAQYQPKFQQYIPIDFVSAYQQ
jgi:Zn-dependent peptidase ImmA (M78 family)